MNKPNKENQQQNQEQNHIEKEQQQNRVLNNHFFWTFFINFVRLLLIQNFQVMIPPPQQIHFGMNARPQLTQAFYQQKRQRKFQKKTRSHVINLMFSYFSDKRNVEKIVAMVVTKLGKSPQNVSIIASILQNVMRAIDIKRTKLEMDKHFVSLYFKPYNLITQIPMIEEQLRTIGVITIEELCLIYRMATFYYFRSISHLAIITSRLRRCILKKDQFTQKRSIEQAMNMNQNDQ